MYIPVPHALCPTLSLRWNLYPLMSTWESEMESLSQVSDMHIMSKLWSFIRDNSISSILRLLQFSDLRYKLWAFTWHKVTDLFMKVGPGFGCTSPERSMSRLHRKIPYQLWSWAKKKLISDERVRSFGILHFLERHFKCHRPIAARYDDRLAVMVVSRTFDVVFHTQGYTSLF